MRISRTLVLSILFAGSAQASSWSDLWYRRDQQGERALQAGDSKHAAELFADPRRQAYAQLQSEQYAVAAKRLEPFADAGSQYNRGNALAKSGDLQGALNAYDGALKHADLESSLRRDAQHNRDLVARQLQTQKGQQQSSSGKQSSSGQQPPPKGKEDGKPQGNESKDGSGDSGSASPSQGEKNKPQGGEPSGSTPPSQPSLQSSPSQGKAGDEQRQANGTPQSTKDQKASSPQASQQQAAEQQAAEQQANAGRQEQSPGSASRNGTEQLNSGKAASDDSLLPQTEQQLALEQWLRQIPDDPGGLLRRKFMIEHLMKQQQVQP